MTRIANAPNQLETHRLNALVTLLSHMDKGAAAITAGASNIRGAVLGSYSLAWALAGRVARQTLSVGVSGLASGGPSDSAVPMTQMVKLSITRPVSFADFNERITNWIMICHSTGIGHVFKPGIISESSRLALVFLEFCLLPVCKLATFREVSGLAVCFRLC